MVTISRSLALRAAPHRPHAMIPAVPEKGRLVQPAEASLEQVRRQVPVLGVVGLEHSDEPEARVRQRVVVSLIGILVAAAVQ